MVLKDRYDNPLCKRYASREMQEIFSDDRKISTWRKLWLILAESEKELGLDISQEQLDEMRSHLYDIDYETARKREAEVRHDVMAHIYTFALACPKAKPIIHLGATSCYVGDNTDLILQRDALRLIRRLLLNAIKATADFAEKYKDLPTLAYTHFQAAQPTTVGKRATLWLQDLVMDLEQLDFCLGNLKLLGCRGTTGTGASFLEEIIFGVIPQVFPLWISYSLYRFEANVRSATVVGMVGAGGIGMVLWELFRSFNFQQTCAVMAIIVLVVTLFDLLSQRLRKMVL